jgi:murein DD-endopeptidase MepM/ murein hydrolase activator NlpD
MAVTGLKSSKITMYKMVSLPAGGGSKDAAIKSTQLSYRAFTTGLNRIGGTINSTIVVNKQIRDALIINLKLKDKEFEEEKKRFQKEKEEKNKVAKKGFSGFAAIGKAVERVAIGFLQGLALLGGALMKFVLTQSILRWIGNPANIQKLTTVVQAIWNVISFFAKLLSSGVTKMLDGLATMLDGKKNIFEKIGGFVTFVAGFGTILGASLILKKPGLVLKGVHWVLTTLWANLFKTKLSLAKRSAGGATKGAAGGFASWSADQSAKGAKGGRFGGIAKGIAAASAIAVPVVVGAQMASGPDEFSSAPGSVSGGTGGTDGTGGGSGGGDTGLAKLAMGGVATRPTSALIGEAGPEVRMPLSNAKAMQNSGIKPLSSLGGMFTGSGDSKQAKKLSDLFMAPFRGIGAGILANISQIVSSIGPAGQALTPILSNIITPIANSFGVPPSLVKTLTAKTQIGSKPQDQGKGGKGKGDISKIFGKGKVVIEDSKKFKKVADTSVLGLLSNMIAAVHVIGNKVGGSTPTQKSTPTTTPTPTSPPPGQGDTPKVTSGAQGGGASGGPTNTAKATLQKADGLREDGSLKGVQGTTIKATDKKASESSPGAGLLPVKNGNRQYWYNESGDVFMWKNPGDPLTDITSSGLIDSKSLKGVLVRDLKTGEVKILQGMFGGDQTPVGYFNYAMGSILKVRGKKTGRAGNTPDKWEKPTDGKYGPTITPNTSTPSKESTPSKARGGWISGPMSGYPVSLDGGGSTAFIGHGTEWVGMKAASGGAFVVPFDTPATRNNPGLTGSRMRQAKQGGYALPGYAKGGAVKDKTKVKDNKGSGDKGLQTATSGGAVITSLYGPRWGRFHAGIDLAGVPVGTPITSLTGGKVLYASTYSGYGNTVDLQVSPSKVLRFAHLDGFLVKKGDVIQPGTKIGTLGNTGIGTGPHLHYEHRSRLSFGQEGSFDPLKTGALNDITIGGKPVKGAQPGTEETPENPIKLDGEQQEQGDPFQVLEEAIKKLHVSLGYAPSDTSVADATESTDKAKTNAIKAAKEKAAASAGKAMDNAKAKVKAATKENRGAPPQPIFMPGKVTTIPIEVAWAPTTSLYQPSLSLLQ